MPSTSAQIRIIYCERAFFAAQFWGGLLQASFTIFGVIGGPLFGLFTLGMFVPRGNQRVNEIIHFSWVEQPLNHFLSSFSKGAVLSMTCAITFLLWIGFGGPKPPPQTLPFSTDGCSIDSLPQNGTQVSIAHSITEAKDAHIE